MISSLLSDLMKSTAVDESLSKTSTNVLFQRIPTNFKVSSVWCQRSFAYIIVIEPEGTQVLVTPVKLRDSNGNGNEEIKMNYKYLFGGESVHSV